MDLLDKWQFRYIEKPDFEIKTYECPSFICEAPVKSCFFCKHMEDILYDIHGPWLVTCEYKDKDAGNGQGCCELFEEVI